MTPDHSDRDRDAYLGRVDVRALYAEVDSQSDHCLDPVVEANRQLLKTRSHVGIRKYGVTLEGSGLTDEQLVQHALEETLDLANYLQALLRNLRRNKDDGK